MTFRYARNLALALVIAVGVPTAAHADPGPTTDTTIPNGRVICDIPEGITPVGFGDDDPAVRILQKHLKRHGYLSWRWKFGTYFGKNTKRAVGKYQKKHGLTVTNMADTATWDELRQQDC